MIGNEIGNLVIEERRRARNESRTGMSFKQEVSTSKFEIESFEFISE
jgi:hypothetical protein